MATLFLHVRRPKSGYFQPETPLLAFSRFETNRITATGGGVAVLTLEHGGRIVGNATFDWLHSDVRHDPEIGDYLVAEGELEEVDIPSIFPFSDEEKVAIVVDGIRSAGWAFEIYDPEMSDAEAAKRFAAWIEANL